MNTGAKEAPLDIEEFVRSLPPHLTENFEKADRQLQELYGSSPGVTALVRLWLACGTSSLIQREFEIAVMDLKRRGLSPNAEGEFDEDCL